MKIIGADIISQTVGTTTSFLGYDGHGSTRTLTDAVGAVADTFHFDGYGMDLGWGRDTDVEYNQVNKPATDMLYSGEQYDTPLQMQSLRARYYDQNVGGFNRLDDYAGRLKEPQSLHKYAYCHDDPVNGVDPSGEAFMTIISFLWAQTLSFGMRVKKTSASLWAKYKILKSAEKAMILLNALYTAFEYSIFDAPKNMPKWVAILVGLIVGAIEGWMAFNHPGLAAATATVLKDGLAMAFVAADPNESIAVQDVISTAVGVLVASSVGPLLPDGAANTITNYMLVFNFGRWKSLFTNASKIDW